jgi:hypothetical protein
LPSEEGIEEAQPPLWYLKDKDGKLKPALGWTPEVLEELWQIKAGLKQQEQIPRFAIQWMSGAGTAKGDFAELKIELKILVRDEHGVRIPLRLNQAILREGAQYEGSGQQSVQFEESGDGYVCFIRGGAGEVHRLTLNVLVPLSRIGSETRLKLSTPRGADWEMKLRVPGAGVVARASEGATLLAPSSAAENVSELIALGHGGDLELAWRKAGDPPAQGPSVLEAVGEILAKADGRTIRMEAKLNVRGYGSPFDRLRVRLPKGAVLAAAETADYTVRPVSKEAAPPDSGQVVEVQLAKETVGPEEIRLNAEIAHEAASESPVELAGFEVLGAARQWGYVGIHVAGDWHIRCEANRHIRQVEALPERLRSENVVAGFEYFRQPFSLTARVVPRETRISVEPEYLLLIEATQVQLRAKLKYTVRGAKAFGLNVELPRWQLDEVGPENLVSVEGVQVDTKTGLLSIPLSQPTVGQIEVVLRAKLPIRGDEQPLLLELPRPQATSLGPAAVVVLPADNVELVPDAESTTGLVRQQIVPNLELPQWQQEPLFYRTDGVKSQFATVVRVRSRRVSVAVSTHVAVEPQKAKVEQKLGYLIAYEPTDRLDLEVPRGLAAAGRMQVSLGDQTLSLGDVPDADEPHGQDAPVRKRVALPSVRIGVCELVVRYSVDLEEPKSGASVINTIPLVMPADGELTDNTLLVTTAEALRAQHRQGPWRVQEDGEPGARRVESLSLSAPERVGQIVLNIIRRQYNLSGSTTVSRAWIQTWLVGQSRQDRAVFQFTSDRENLEVVIPAGVNLSDVDLRLDGRAISGQPTPTGQIVVPLGSKSGLQPRRLEVYYHFGRPRPGTGTLSVELPRLGPEVWVRRDLLLNIAGSGTGGFWVASRCWTRRRWKRGPGPSRAWRHPRRQTATCSAVWGRSSDASCGPRRAPSRCWRPQGQPWSPACY